MLFDGAPNHSIRANWTIHKTIHTVIQSHDHADQSKNPLTLPPGQ